MVSEASPSAPGIEVIGVYLPKSDKPRCERYITEWLTTFADPSDEEEEERLRELEEKLGRSLRFSDEDRREREEEFREYFLNVALVEVLVTNPDERFDVGHFLQPDPAVQESQWQAPWSELFLSPNGEEVVGEGYQGQPKNGCFRVVFYVHFWKDDVGLLSSYGPLACPAPRAIPERLWRLVPYDMPG